MKFNSTNKKIFCFLIKLIEINYIFSFSFKKINCSSELKQKKTLNLNENI